MENSIVKNNEDVFDQIVDELNAMKDIVEEIIGKLIIEPLINIVVPGFGFPDGIELKDQLIALGAVYSMDFLGNIRDPKAFIKEVSDAIKENLNEVTMALTATKMKASEIAKEIAFNLNNYMIGFKMLVDSAKKWGLEVAKEIVFNLNNYMIGFKMLVVSARMNVAAFAVTAVIRWETFRQFEWPMIVDSVKTNAASFASAAIKVGIGIKDAFMGFLGFMKGIFVAIGAAISSFAKSALAFIMDKLLAFIASAAFQVALTVAGILSGMIVIRELFEKMTRVNNPYFDPNINMAADGGFQATNQHFIAREAGPEIVGTLNGRTAVANNDQIVEGVRAGVFRAVRDALNDSNSNSPAIARVFLDGKEIAMSRQS